MLGGEATLESLPALGDLRLRIRSNAIPLCGANPRNDGLDSAPNRPRSSSIGRPAASTSLPLYGVGVTHVDRVRLGLSDPMMARARGLRSPFRSEYLDRDSVKVPGGCAEEVLGCERPA